MLTLEVIRVSGRAAMCGPLSFCHHAGVVAALTMKDVLPYAAVGLAVAVALAGYQATRKDERYKVAAGERDEYRARAARLEADLVAARIQITRIARLTPADHVAERLDKLIVEAGDLRESLDVHADPQHRDRRSADQPGTLRRRITDR